MTYQSHFVVLLAATPGQFPRWAVEASEMPTRRETANI
jgi:hypothetical protein